MGIPASQLAYDPAIYAMVYRFLERRGLPTQVLEDIVAPFRAEFRAQLSETMKYSQLRRDPVKRFEYLSNVADSLAYAPPEVVDDVLSEIRENLGESAVQTVLNMANNSRWSNILSTTQRLITSTQSKFTTVEAAKEFIKDQLGKLGIQISDEEAEQAASVTKGLWSDISAADVAGRMDIGVLERAVDFIDQPNAKAKIKQLISQYREETSKEQPDITKLESLKETIRNELRKIPANREFVRVVNEIKREAGSEYDRIVREAVKAAGSISSAFKSAIQRVANEVLQAHKTLPNKELAFIQKLGSVVRSFATGGGLPKPIADKLRQISNKWQTYIDTVKNSVNKRDALVSVLSEIVNEAVSSVYDYASDARKLIAEKYDLSYDDEIMLKYLGTVTNLVNEIAGELNSMIVNYFVTGEIQRPQPTGPDTGQMLAQLLSRPPTVVVPVPQPQPQLQLPMSIEDRKTLETEQADSLVDSIISWSIQKAQSGKGGGKGTGKGAGKGVKIQTPAKFADMVAPFKRIGAGIADWNKEFAKFESNLAYLKSANSMLSGAPQYKRQLHSLVLSAVGPAVTYSNKELAKFFPRGSEREFKTPIEGLDRIASLHRSFIVRYSTEADNIKRFLLVRFEELRRQGLTPQQIIDRMSSDQQIVAALNRLSELESEINRRLNALKRYNEAVNIVKSQINPILSQVRPSSTKLEQSFPMSPPSVSYQPFNYRSERPTAQSQQRPKQQSTSQSKSKQSEGSQRKEEQGKSVWQRLLERAIDWAARRDLTGYGF